jgi:hypothetical protein
MSSSIKNKRSKKEWKWKAPRTSVKKDLMSNKYRQRIVPKKNNTNPTIKEGLNDYYEE